MARGGHRGGGHGYGGYGQYNSDQNDGGIDDPHWHHGGGHAGHGGILLGIWAFVSTFPNLARALTLLALLWLLKGD